MKKLMILFLLLCTNNTYTCQISIPKNYIYRHFGKCTIYYAPDLKCKFRENDGVQQFIIPKYYSMVIGSLEVVYAKRYFIEQFSGTLIYHNKNLQDILGNKVEEFNFE